MREIKFNAVDQENGDYIVYNDWMNIGKCESGETPNECLSIFLDFYYGYKLLQYTGLKDKNGAEIYDGDIVYCNNVYYEVVWEVSKAVEFKITKQSERKYPDVYKQYFGFNANKHIEVIGNIYKNPELLK